MKTCLMCGIMRSDRQFRDGNVCDDCLFMNTSSHSQQ